MKLQMSNSLGNFKFNKNNKTLTLFKSKLAIDLRNTFQLGVINPPKTGRKYSNLPNRSSRANEFPANQTGALLRSIRSSYNKDSVTVGSNKYYSKFLATGTAKMATRRMSRYVLQNTQKILPEWVEIVTK